MKKQIAAGMAACMMICGQAFAQEREQIVSEAYYCAGTLYYCDAARSKVVLQNVKPMGKVTAQNTAMAQDAEYIEMDVLGKALVEDGSEVDLAICNRFADCNVRALIVRSAKAGLQVVRLQFI